MHKPKDSDIMVSRAALVAFKTEPAAAVALQDLFALHGRRTFFPRIEELRGAMWRERGARQEFARAIAVLHVNGFIRRLPGGHYKIITKLLQTVAEYQADHPNAQWNGGVSWTTPEESQP